MEPTEAATVAASPIDAKETTDASHLDGDLPRPGDHADSRAGRIGDYCSRRACTYQISIERGTSAMSAWSGRSVATQAGRPGPRCEGRGAAERPGGRPDRDGLC